MKDGIIVENIIKCVANAYNLLPEELMAKRRTAVLAEARYVAFYLIGINTNHTLETIGQALGSFTPASVHYGFVKIAELVQTDSDIQTKISDITREVNHVAG